MRGEMVQNDVEVAVHAVSRERGLPGQLVHHRDGGGELVIEPVAHWQGAADVTRQLLETLEEFRPLLRLLILSPNSYLYIDKI